MSVNIIHLLQIFTTYLLFGVGLCYVVERKLFTINSRQVFSLQADCAGAPPLPLQHMKTHLSPNRWTSCLPSARQMRLCLVSFETFSDISTHDI